MKKHTGSKLEQLLKSVSFISEIDTDIITRYINFIKKINVAEEALKRANMAPSTRLGCNLSELRIRRDDVRQIERSLEFKKSRKAMTSLFDSLDEELCNDFLINLELLDIRINKLNDVKDIESLTKMQFILRKVCSYTFTPGSKQAIEELEQFKIHVNETKIYIKK